MAWEERNDRMYYYRKRREGKRVISEYIGNGFIGQMAEILDMEDRAEAEQARAVFQQQRDSAKAMDIRVNQVDKYTRTIMRAFLLLAGYHTHKRQWRKIRS
jgi:hypothetical protein